MSTDNLPARTTAAALTVATDQPGSLLTRGLEAIKGRQIRLVSIPADADSKRSLATTYQAPDEAEGFYRRGRQYLDEGQYDRAIENFNEAIQLRADYADAFLSRGIAYREKMWAFPDYVEGIIRDYKERAIPDFEKVIQLNPEEHSAHYYMGDYHSFIGQHELAIQDYSESIRLNPNNAIAFLGRGRAHLVVSVENDQTRDLAIQDYNEAIRLKPNYAEAFSSRGFVYILDRQYACAIQDYSLSILLNPESADAFHWRGRAYTDTGQLDLAVRDFDEAIRLDPNHHDAFYRRGVALGALGLEAQSAADLAKAKQVYPKLVIRREDIAEARRRASERADKQRNRNAPRGE